jgi:hypothetical protein
MSAIEGKAEVVRSHRAFPVLAINGHWLWGISTEETEVKAIDRIVGVADDWLHRGKH